jgi:hypothetical protein
MMSVLLFRIKPLWKFNLLRDAKFLTIDKPESHKLLYTFGEVEGQYFGAESGQAVFMGFLSSYKQIPEHYLTVPFYMNSDINSPKILNSASESVLINQNSIKSDIILKQRKTCIGLIWAEIKFCQQCLLCIINFNFNRKLFNSFGNKTCR